MSSNEYCIKINPSIQQNICLNNKKVIVFGIGKNGKRIVDFLLKREYNIVEIWDNNTALNKYKGINICKPHQSYKNDVTIIVTVTLQNIKNQILNQCKDLGYVNVLEFEEVLISENLSYDEYLIYMQLIQSFRLKKLYKKNNFSLKSLQIAVTERCSLKCKECTALIQYFKNPKHMNIDITLESLNNVLTSVDYVERIVLIGGEPFTYKNLYKYLEVLKKYHNIGVIAIVTNGTIIPSIENIKALKDDRILVQISNYGSLSKNLCQIENIFKKENIFYSVLTVDSWIECKGIEKHNRTEKENKLIFKDCHDKQCLTIKNENLFRCPFLAHAQSLNAIEKNDIECVNLHEKNLNILIENLKKYLCKDLFLCCDYCIGRSISNNKIVPVAEQVSEPLTYHEYL